MQVEYINNAISYNTYKPFSKYELIAHFRSVLFLFIISLYKLECIRVLNKTSQNFLFRQKICLERKYMESKKQKC